MLATLDHGPHSARAAALAAACGLHLKVGPAPPSALASAPPVSLTGRRWRAWQLRAVSESPALADGDVAKTIALLVGMSPRLCPLPSPYSSCRTIDGHQGARLGNLGAAGASAQTAPQLEEIGKDYEL